VETEGHKRPQENLKETRRDLQVLLTQLKETSGQVLQQLKGAPASQVEDLLRVEVRLLQHYIRLEAAAQQLAQSRERRAPRRTSAIRQIERERQRLSVELHTGVGQLLSGVRLQLEIVKAQLPAPGPAVEKALERIATLNAEALEQVRSLSQRLHPPAWQSLSLEAAIQQLWDLSGIPERFESHLRVEPLEPQPELESKVLIYRAAQEAVSNLIRHSRATRVEAALEAQAGQVVLRFADNGVGFDARDLLSSTPSLTSGMGLRTIREQAEALGGSFQITAGEGGTELEISVPLAPTAS
jgi:two-component system, NarL family, sensor kinase